MMYTEEDYVKDAQKEAESMGISLSEYLLFQILDKLNDIEISINI